MALYLKRICYNLDSELNKFEVGGELRAGHNCEVNSKR